MPVAYAGQEVRPRRRLAMSNQTPAGSGRLVEPCISTCFLLLSHRALQQSRVLLNLGAQLDRQRWIDPSQ